MKAATSERCNTHTMYQSAKVILKMMNNIQ